MIGVVPGPLPDGDGVPPTDIRAAASGAAGLPPTRSDAASFDAPPSGAEGSGGGGTLLSVTIGGRRRTVPAASVMEVRPMPPLTRLPGAAADVMGIAWVRGALRLVIGPEGAPLVDDPLLLVTAPGLACVAIEAIPDLVSSTSDEAEPILLTQTEHSG